MPAIKVTHSIQLAFDQVNRELAKKEAKWQKEWDDIACPFTKVTVYCSDAKRAERRKMYDKWHKVKDKLDAARARNLHEGCTI